MVLRSPLLPRLARLSRPVRLLTLSTLLSATPRRRSSFKKRWLKRLPRRNVTMPRLLVPRKWQSSRNSATGSREMLKRMLPTASRLQPRRKTIFIRELSRSASSFKSKSVLTREI